MVPEPKEQPAHNDVLQVVGSLGALPLFGHAKITGEGKRFVDMG